MFDTLLSFLNVLALFTAKYGPLLTLIFAIINGGIATHQFISQRNKKYLAYKVIKHELYSPQYAPRRFNHRPQRVQPGCVSMKIWHDGGPSIQFHNPLSFDFAANAQHPNQ